MQLLGIDRLPSGYTTIIRDLAPNLTRLKLTTRINSNELRTLVNDLRQYLFFAHRSLTKHSKPMSDARSSFPESLEQIVFQDVSTHESSTSFRVVKALEGLVQGFRKLYGSDTLILLPNWTQQDTEREFNEFVRDWKHVTIGEEVVWDS